ncbi:hypothetical protein FRC12_009482 [Ceratobasidium sp. 428]|nr:hypothetical protein FRC12_009482 [Ceratobasidium sp. 428]
MSTGPSELGVAYDLPAAIKSIQSGWLATFRSSSNISTIFAVIQAILMVFSNSVDSKLLGKSSGHRTIRVLNFLAFFFSASATFCSLVLTSEFGKLHVRAAQREPALNPLTDMTIQESTNELLRRYDSHRTLLGMIMLLTSFLSLLAQLLVYVWVLETRPVAIAVSCVAGFAILPMFSIFSIS